MNGNRSHLLCRPVFIDDAKEKLSTAQEPRSTKFLKKLFQEFYLTASDMNRGNEVRQDSLADLKLAFF